MTEPSEIRDAIVKRMPRGNSLVLDVKVSDGLADISVQCGSLRFAGIYGIGDRTPKQMAAIAENGFRAWAINTLETIFKPGFLDEDRPKLEETFGHYHRAGRGFRQWFLEDPDARDWLRRGVKVAA